MKLTIVLVVTACLVGSCLSEPAAKPDPAPKPFPEALAAAFAKAYPQGAVGDLLSGLSTLLQNLLMALLGGGMASMMSGGGGGGGGDEGGGGGGDCCGGCDSCGCGCCIETCVAPFYPRIIEEFPVVEEFFGGYPFGGGYGGYRGSFYG